jgi:peptidyl-prolyl cis-trans isomerase D
MCIPFAATGSGKVALGSTALANGDQALLEVVRVVPGQKDALSEMSGKRWRSNWRSRSVGQFEGLLDSVRTKTKVVTHADRL